MSESQPGEMDAELGAAIDRMGLDTFAGIMRTILETLAMAEAESEQTGRPMQRRWSQEALRERRRLREQLRAAETRAGRERLFAELTELEKDQRMVPVEDSDAASEDGADAEAVDPDV